jgi:hypothetical protein
MLILYGQNEKKFSFMPRLIPARTGYAQYTVLARYSE